MPQPCRSDSSGITRIDHRRGMGRARGGGLMGAPPGEPPIADGFTGAAEPKPNQAKPPSAASQLVDMALNRYNFGITEDGQPYAVRPGRHVVRMLRGGKNSLRAELSQAYYRAHKKAAPQQALADALLVLEGMAQDQDPKQVHLRVAAAAGLVWLDLGDAAETVVSIDANGWQVVRDGVPVLFRRTGLTGALPEPQGASHASHASHNSYLSLGTFDPLWCHINVATTDRPLVLAWLIAALTDPESPHPILSLFGEQGTGKSTASRRIVSVVDPSPRTAAETTTRPRRMGDRRTRLMGSRARQPIHGARLALRQPLPRRNRRRRRTPSPLHRF